MRLHTLVWSLPFVMTAALAAATVTIGSNDTGNCYPFSCGPSDGRTRYQQVYAATEFGHAPLAINSLTFFLYEGGGMDDANYTLTLSTTPRTVTGLSVDLDSNVGADAAFFTSLHLGGAMPDSITFTGTPFVYDPSEGNLLLDVSISGATPLGGYNSFFQADMSGTTTRRVWAPGGQPASPYALVTRFDFTPTAVPEPATFGILPIGAIALFFFRRRR